MLDEDPSVQGEVLPAVQQVVPVHMESLVRQADEMREMRRQGGILITDLEIALNLIRRYAAILRDMNVPDPRHVEARQLLRKYGMEAPKAAEGFKVYADGVDITEHPDSIPGMAVEEELVAGVETLELVGDEEGNMAFVGHRTELPPRPEDPDAPEEIEDPTGETRDWLTEEDEDHPFMIATIAEGTDLVGDPGPTWDEAPRLATIDEINAVKERKRVGAFAQRPVASSD